MWQASIKARENKYLSNYKSDPPYQVAKLNDFLFKILKNCTIPMFFDFEQKVNQLLSTSHIMNGYP